jgi:hypothetical protein
LPKSSLEIKPRRLFAHDRSCRTGVGHNCESGLISGTVVYGPDPLDKPADGNLLVCCSQPLRDIVIDL